jgi:hypothetical protein
MKTFVSLEAAREYAATNRDVREIAEIEHASEGCCFICTLAPFAALKAHLEQRPNPEIKRLIAGHDKLTPEQRQAKEAADQAEHERYLREDTRCERCGQKIDGNTAYHQEEWTRFGGKKVKCIAYYCDPCRHLLASCGDGEMSDLEHRAAHVPSPEPYTKED